jgi:hypothetical protein
MHREKFIQNLVGIPEQKILMGELDLDGSKAKVDSNG